ncbi:ribosomal large subunit pseudouridine synthase D [Lachnospiraceae bacterium KM106-2]|nr:ribosomal large subunit pseudouridine synthase D [Lachnospiraceae bacterium KM106-2]
MVRNLQYIIEEKDSGVAIRTFLEERGYSTSLIRALKKIPTGVLLNKEPVFVKTIVSEGDQLEICMKEEIEEDIYVPLPYDLHILYEDEDILVVNKPHDMPIHQSMNNYSNTLANAVSYYSHEKGEAYVFRCINRLDRDTTGATIIAKNTLSAAVLSAQVRERKIHRTYLALVEGITKEEDVIDLPIARKEESVIERQVDEVNGKRAVTHYRRLGVYQAKEKDISLLSLKLETGRTHQIRVHMSHIGHPLLGDFLYNEDCTLMNRQALHSASLRFTHPVTGEELFIEAPLPEDMKQFIKVSY